MLPEKYKWIEDIGILPKLLAAGLQYYGIKEIKGQNNNPVIMDMAKGLGLQNIYKNDDESWCAVFINHLIRITGKPPVNYGKDKYNLLRAKYLLNWGNEVPKGQEQLGDILVFNREGGGHVCIYAGETATTFLCYGGNQSDAVGFTEIAKNRLAGSRRYYATQAPQSAKKYLVNSTGIVSTNEA